MRKKILYNSIIVVKTLLFIISFSVISLPSIMEYLFRLSNNLYPMKIKPEVTTQKLNPLFTF